MGSYHKCSCSFNKNVYIFIIMKITWIVNNEEGNKSGYSYIYYKGKHWRPPDKKKQIKIGNQDFYITYLCAHLIIN